MPEGKTAFLIIALFLSYYKCETKISHGREHLDLFYDTRWTHVDGAGFHFSGTRLSCFSTW